MSIKPDALPVPWASAALYPAEVYPATYPPNHPLAGQPHPLAGQATPWSGQPTADEAAESVVALYGLRPGKPVPSVGVNSRERKVDGWLAWLDAGETGLEAVEVPATARVVETTSGGATAVRRLYVRRLDGLSSSHAIDGVIEILVTGGTVQSEGRREFSSHEPEFEWDTYRINERTFTAEGTVPGSPYIVTWPLTSELLVDNNRLFADFPPGCTIAFDYTIEVYVGDGFDPSDRVTYHTSRRTAVWTRFAGAYTIETHATATGVVDLGAGIQPLTISADAGKRVDMRVLFAAAHAGFAYRATAHVVARVIRLADE